MIQIIYTSAATHEFTPDEFSKLLTRARTHNAHIGVTGILLHAQGSFFQVLEGEPDVLDTLLETIFRDPRHTNLTVIIREPIARRAFGDWSMGFADVNLQEVQQMVGLSNFFVANDNFAQLDSGRAKKLLSAFKEGRWRTKITGRLKPTGPLRLPSAEIQRATLSSNPDFSFSYQPIVHAGSQKIISYEALLRGINNESAATILQRVNFENKHLFDENCRAVAIDLAARLGLTCSLNLNFLPLSLSTLEKSIFSTLETAHYCGLHPQQIVLEIVESEIIRDIDDFARAVNAHRGTGLRIAIDDFGAGYAGLALLADFQPEIVKLDMNLVRDIERKGPRQAIIRGISRTCHDLGIDLIAEGVETVAEYAWCQAEGIELFQGNLFAAPAFEQLPPAFFPQDEGISR